MTSAEAVALWGLVLVAFILEVFGQGGTMLFLGMLTGSVVMVLGNPTATGTDLGELAAQGAGVPLVLWVLTRLPRAAIRRFLKGAA